MKVLKCDDCGARLEYNGEGKVVCPYCGAVHISDEEKKVKDSIDKDVQAINDYVEKELDVDLNGVRPQINIVVVVVLLLLWWPAAVIYLLVKSSKQKKWDNAHNKNGSSDKK